MHNRLNKQQLAKRKALELGLQRRREQKVLLENFIAANPDYQIQLNFSVEGKPYNTCFKLTGIFAHKLLPKVMTAFLKQMKDIETRLIEMDTNPNTQHEQQ